MWDVETSSFKKNMPTHFVTTCTGGLPGGRLLGCMSADGGGGSGGGRGKETPSRERCSTVAHRWGDAPTKSHFPRHGTSLFVTVWDMRAKV